MLAYIFDRTFDGVLSAVFDAYFRHQSPDLLLGKGDQLPLFCEETYEVTTSGEKAQRVWKGLEKKLSKEALHLIMVSWQSEEKELSTPLLHYIYKVFAPRNSATASKDSIEHNYADPDVLYVRNTARRVLHEQLRMKQFIRFQKAKDGTYLAVVSPDNDVLPLVINHFQDRFNDQPWLIYDAKRHYGYNHDGKTVVRITFEDEAAVPFNLENGKLNDEVLSSDDRLLQDLWRTYFKAICIKERLNPRKQLNDMPRRYWKYLTEKN
ncbi:MAG: TIGR03915 family putative DNA repair protein [Prevotella sp.]|nr:TIGR03915 family putative DNA repair protein [Prevotella sp.]